MGRTRASAAATAVASDSAGDGWAFRGAARSQGQEATDNYSYGLIEGVDPDVYDLCIEYEVDDRKMRKLHQLMMNRIDTFESDILKLWDSVKNARSPAAVITIKMRDMENGTFIGKAPKRYYSEKPLKDFYKRHDIDALCKDSLADALYDRRLRIIRERKLRGGGADGDGFPEKDMVEILEKLSREIDGSRNPSALVMRHVPAIEAGTGSWESVGQVQKCKEAPVEKQIELSKEELRAEEDRQAQQVEKAQRAKRETPQVSKSSKESQRKIQKPPKGSHSQSKPSAVPAFDSAELAKRLSKSAQNENKESSSANRSDEVDNGKRQAVPAPQTQPAPPQPVPPPIVAPPPEPVKRNMLPVKLSKKSLELVEKTSDGVKDEAGSAIDAVGTSSAVAHENPGGQNDEDDEDLEMASIALGRPVAELKKLPQEEVRALVLASLAGGGGSNRSASPSLSEDDDAESAQGFDGMSELEVASIALGRPIEELRKLPEEELRSLIAKGSDPEVSLGRSSPSSPVKNHQEDTRTLDRELPDSRSKSIQKAGKEADAKKRSRSSARRIKRSASREKAGREADAKKRSRSSARRMKRSISREKAGKEADAKKRSRSSARRMKRAPSREKAGKEADVKRRSRSSARRIKRSASRSRSCRSGAPRRSEARASSGATKAEKQPSKHSPRRTNSRSPHQRRARKGNSPSRKHDSPDRNAVKRVPRRSSSRSRSHGRGRTRR